jgi:hypothetical protein
MDARKVVVEEDWEVLKAALPADWEDLARQSGALKGLRQDKAAEPLLRTLLWHVGGGHSLRETVLRAQAAGWAHLSDVALLKRLRKSKAWLQRLCEALVAERGLPAPAPGAPPLRLIDATVVQAPGPRGPLWRLHYSFQWPTLACDGFRLTACKGPDTGESLRRYPFTAGEYVLADRGYGHAPGLQAAARQGAFVTVRLNPHTVCLQNEDGAPFALQAHLEGLPTPGQVGEWPVWVAAPGQPPLAARLCALRKSQAATARAQRQVKRKARKNRTRRPRPEALRYAPYVLVLSTFPPAQFSAAQVLEAYRYRWQVELVFKRFKQLLGLGQLPKTHPDSAQAWLYGKLCLALLAEKLIAQARALSPWGYALAGPARAQPLA